MLAGIDCRPLRPPARMPSAVSRRAGECRLGEPNSAATVRQRWLERILVPDLVARDVPGPAARAAPQSRTDRFRAKSRSRFRGRISYREPFKIQALIWLTRQNPSSRRASFVASLTGGVAWRNSLRRPRTRAGIHTGHGNRANVPPPDLSASRQAAFSLRDKVPHRVSEAKGVKGDFIFGGIFDKFPKLQLITGEYECSWFPY